MKNNKKENKRKEVKEEFNINRIDTKLDKNENYYLIVSYTSRSGRECKIVLNHYDIAYMAKGKIRYEINKK